MQGDHDDEMLPEYDLSNAVRGKFANWFTPEQREQLLRDAAEGDARAWHRFALNRVQALEASLFTWSVLTGVGPHGRDVGLGDMRPFSALVRLVRDLPRRTPLGRRLMRRLDDLTVECEWVVAQGQPGARGTLPEQIAYVERLERIGREAEAVKAEVDAAVQHHLARSGLSEQEIERKTEETARLWQAA